MHLTLFVPDLLWPDVNDSAAFDVPGTNGLTQFLSLSQRSEKPLTVTDSWESCLADLFGFVSTDTRPPPLAPLRSLGDGLSDGAIRLCTDPVNLDFVQHSLVLSPIPTETLSPADVAALLASLNQEFKGDGQFITAAGSKNLGRWYYAPSYDTALPDLAACSRLAGRRIDADKTRQMLSRENLRWLNRIQMCLNEHPVNTAREAMGLPRVNSLWPWGAGTLATVPEQRFASARSSDASALLRGLCLSTKTPLAAAGSPPDIPGKHLVCELGLNEAVITEDLAAWQSALCALDQTWITPALLALRSRGGSLETLTLISPDAHRQQCWTLHRQQRASPGAWFKRCLGIEPKRVSLSALVRSW